MRKIYENDEMHLIDLIKSGFSIDFEDEYGFKIIHIACREAYLDLFKILIKYGANIESKTHSDWRPLHFAVSGEIEIMKNNGNSCSRFEIVSLLLDSGAVINSKNNQGDEPLHIAAMFGSIKIVERLIVGGSLVNGRNNCGRSPLSHASSSNPSVIQILIDHSAQLDCPDNLGLTPMHWAAKSGCEKSLSILLRNGAEINCMDNDLMRPIHYSCLNFNKSIEALVILVESGADANVFDCRLNSPLHFCAQMGYLEKAKILLNLNVCVNVRNDGGIAPIHLAAKNGHVEFVQFLLMHGCDCDALDNIGNNVNKYVMFCNNLDKRMNLLDLVKQHKAVGVTTSQSGPSTECHTGLTSNHEQNPAGIPPAPSEPSSRDPQKP